MCGIAGIIGRDERCVRQALPAMIEAQAHRGPDDQGAQYIRFGAVCLGLGHRRLSILDLSDSGHEPMIHARTGNQLVYNGEIYNFPVLRRELELQGVRFQGNSDAEVLLHALTEWGVDGIRRLQGMFAFGFFDARRSQLLLARDSIGIKPLYVADLPNGELVFASEVRAILASGLVDRELDPRGIATLLAYGAVQHPTTVFRAIRSLAPGTIQIIDAPGAPNGHALRTQSQTFWALPGRGAAIDEQAAVEQVRQVVDAAVRDHLVSDVPVGVFLSSGIDSTIVAGLAARQAPGLRSFTVGFADHPDLSELALARETAAQFGLAHTEIQVTGAHALDATAAWTRSLDQPSMDGFNVYIISKAVHEEGITVALSGQGGDELFGGYSSFTDVPRLYGMMQKTAWVPRKLRRGLAHMATVGKSSAVRQKAVGIAESDGGLLSLYFHRRRAMSNHQIDALGLTPSALGLTNDYMPPEGLADVELDEHDIVWSVSQMETRFYLGNMLLRDGDANGMAHSLEIRVPLLDQRLLDLALRLPGPVRLPAGSRSKHLLRLAFGDLLRPALQAQAKRGFVLPVRRWMLGPLRDLCMTGITAVKSSGLLRSDRVDAIWRTFEQEPESPIWSRALTLCVLGLYVELHSTPKQ